MAQDERPRKQEQSRQFWYSILPLLLTLLAIVFINWVWPSPTNTLPNSPTAVANQRTTPSAITTPLHILPATILPSPIPTDTPRPLVDNTAIITFLGPPSQSSVAVNGRLTFYWDYSMPLLPGQQFVLILQQEETVVRTAPMNAPNLGTSFQLRADFSDLGLSPGTAVWRVQLEWADTQQPLLSSKERSLLLQAE